MNAITNMKLIHYSRQPIARLRSRRQCGKRVRNDKPNGMWVSVENSNHSWHDWCIAEDFSIAALQFPHRVELAPDANILLLDTDDKILAFGEQYHNPPEYASELLKKCTWFINWRAVVKKYQGIIISPYSWTLRLDHRCSWYYGWDCASGVIWNKRAIAKLEGAFE